MQVHSWQKLDDAASRLERLCARPENCSRLATGEVQSVARQLRRLARELRRAHEEKGLTELGAEAETAGPFSFGRGRAVDFPNLLSEPEH